MVGGAGPHQSLESSTPNPSQLHHHHHHLRVLVLVIHVHLGSLSTVALAGATIGVHMNGGTDVAQSAANVVLVRPDVLWLF